MAQQFQVNPYQINSLDPTPLASVQKFGFPAAGVMIRTANDSNGNPGVLLATGVRCYGQINLLATGATYLTSETAATLVTLANV